MKKKIFFPFLWEEGEGLFRERAYGVWWWEGLALELIKALVCILGGILVFEHEDGTAPNVLPLTPPWWIVLS